MGRYTIYGRALQTHPDKILALRRGTVRVPANKLFLRAGDVSSRVFSLYAGWAIQFHSLPEGRRQVLSFLIPGDLCVPECLYFPNLPLSFSIKSLTPAWLCEFDPTDMLNLIQASPETNKDFSAAGHDYLTSLQNRLVDIGRRSALGRIAQLFLELEIRLRQRGLSRNGRFHFPVRQEDLADSLGLHTVYVNRILDRLRKKNVIAFERQWMVIKDPAELQRMVEEN